MNKEFFNEVISSIDNYLQDSQLTHTLNSNELKNKVNISLPIKGSTDSQLLESIKNYLHYSTKTHSPYFMNQLWTGFSKSGLAAEMIATASNTSMYTYEVAPVSTVIEQEIIATMGNKFGYSCSEGTFTPGASYGNMMGLLLARNHKFPKSKTEGLQGQQPVFFTSKVGHYSSFKAANQLGIGEANVIEIETNEQDQMDVVDLKQKIIQAKENGKTPFAVIATMGTTVRSSFDPINDIADICEEFNLWLHADGALGASCIFSEKEKHRLKGIERSDSLIWNAHKMLGLPLHCSLFLTSVENGMGHSNKLSSDKTSYIFRKEKNQNLGPISLQCGRKVDALKLWLAWLEEGEIGFEKRVDHMFAMAAHATGQIKNNSKLYLTYPTTGPNVCFQYKPDKTMSTEHTNKLNLKIRQIMLDAGKTAINFGYVNDDLCIRMVNFHKDLSAMIIDDILNEIVTTGDKAIASL